MTGLSVPSDKPERINCFALRKRSMSFITSVNTYPLTVRLLRSAIFKGRGVTSGLNAPCTIIVPSGLIASAISAICGPPTASNAIFKLFAPKMLLKLSSSGSSWVAITWAAPALSTAAFLAPVRVVAIGIPPRAFTI